LAEQRVVAFSYVVDVAVGEETSTASYNGEDSLAEGLDGLKTLALGVFVMGHFVLDRFPLEELHLV
jgi:hypothetical protein